MKYMLMIYSGSTDAAQCDFEEWVSYDKAMKEAGI